MDGVRTHPEGVDMGLAGLEAFLEEGGSMSGRRRRAASSAAAPLGRFVVPPGRKVDSERMQLHAQVTELAGQRGISYREAVLEHANVHGDGGGFVVPRGYRTEPAQMHLHAQVAELAGQRGISYREAVVELAVTGA